MRYGVQMFGANPYFQKDPEGFLFTMKQAGYRYLEPDIILSPVPFLSEHAWLPEEIEQFRPILDKYGFQMPTCHVFTQDILRDLPFFIEIALENGISEIIFPCPNGSKEECDRMAQVLIKAAEIASKSNIKIGLHNTKAASEERIDGVSVFEWMLNRCEGKVGAQPDVGWLLYGGVDPESFLWKYKDLVLSLHYKDMKNTQSGYQEATIGCGEVDLTACFQFARAAEVLQLMDQDSSENDFVQDLIATVGKMKSMIQVRDNTCSTLNIFDTATGEVTPVKTFPYIIEAPNWMKDDPDSLVFNRDGQLYRFKISTETETLIPSGHCNNCNNDHVLSPDNQFIALSHSETGWMSQVYILPVDGGEPRLITPNAPSYLHGWSPDGEELSYCAFRDHGNGMEVDVYAIPVSGGEEKQLTSNAAFNDGPEYSPDGKHIWFNSTRTGLMQCWRMNRDGSEPTQMTFTQRNNWFPHVSPDGQKVVYLSYSRDGLDANEHLPNMPVQLRMMDSDGNNDRLILSFFGGQGSINVNSWCKDSRYFAFVSYELNHR